MADLFSRITQPAGQSNPATSTSARGGGLFASTTNNATAGSSLFAPSSTSTANPFGAGMVNSNPTQPSNSLFGQPAGSQPPTVNNASLFKEGILSKNEGDQQLPRDDLNAPAPNPAYFEALLQRGKKRQKEEQTGAFGELPQLQLGLQDISRKVRNLGQGGPSAGLTGGADAKAHYLLSASGVSTGQALRDLDDLTGAPVTLPLTSSTFNAGVKETLAQRHQNDFQKMVDSHVQKAQDDFNKMIDEKLHGVDWNAHRQRIYEHFGLKKPQDSGNLSESTATSGPKDGFGRTSRRSRVATSTLDKSFGMPDLARSVIGAPRARGMRFSTFGDVADRTIDGVIPAPEDRILRKKQEDYVSRVKELNVARIQGRLYPVLKAFSEVEIDQSNEDSVMLDHACKALIQMTGENAGDDNASSPGAIKEREYSNAYLDDNAGSGPQTSVRKRIINGARTFLERQFYSQLEMIVGKNPREANVGGVPTSIAMVKGFVRVRASRKELGPDVEILQDLNGDYCWPVIFYMLRSGLYQEALDYVKENGPAFRQIDRSFTRYLQAYVANEDHRLPQEMQNSINNEYSQRARLAPEDTIDPYRMICYRIVGRCDLHKRTLNTISNDVMDWLWLQFSLCREYNRIDEFAHEAFGLDELRESIKEIGEKWFGPSSDVANAPTMLFFMQILAGLYEKAVTDLYAHHYVSATHFAIALDFYGLLRVSDITNSEDLMTFTTRRQPQIAFGSMVGLYTRDFRTADATGAVDYLTLICLNQDLQGDLGKRQRALCHQALTELVLETREFAQLLGDIRSDGQRIKGAIEQRLKLIGLDDEREFLKHITLVAARTAEEQNRTTDAALLFHLAEDYDKVVQVINDALSLALTTELGEEPMRLLPLKPRTNDQKAEKSSSDQELSSLSLTAVDDPMQLAKNMTELYGNQQMYYSKIKESNKDSCLILLRLANARSALISGDWPLVIDHVTASRVLPTEANGNITAIRNAATAFNQLPTVVSRTVGHVMLWTVIACSNNVDKLRGAEFETGAQQNTIQACVQTSKDVMVFAGLIRFKFPGRVWEALAQVGGNLGAY